MADFARFGVALERVAGWPTGSFLVAYEGNRAAGHEITLDAYPIVDALADLVDEHPFDAPAAELLKALDARVDDEMRHRRSWPKSPNALSTQLSRIAPSLGQRSLVVESREVRGRKYWLIAKNEVSAEGSAPSAPQGDMEPAASTDAASASPGRGADQGADRADEPLWGADPLAGPKGADGADRVPIDHRHPAQAQTRAHPVPVHAQGADGAGLALLPSKEREEGEAHVLAELQARLAAGTLDSHAPIRLTAGETIIDVPAVTRRWLAEAERDGPIGAGARAHLVRLAGALGISGTSG